MFRLSYVSLTMNNNTCTHQMLQHVFPCYCSTGFREDTIPKQLYKKECYKSCGEVGIRKKHAAKKHIFSFRQKRWAYERLLALGDSLTLEREARRLTEVAKRMAKDPTYRA